MKIRNLLTLICMACSPASLLAQPEGGTVVLGSGSINQIADNTTINQSTDRLAIDWQSFDIAEGQTVDFIQPSSNAIALNRDFSGTASEIFGNLQSNGSVFIVNQSGVLFGANATINTGGLLVSDLDVSLESFGDGNIAFIDSAPSRGGIRNEGTIETSAEFGVHFISQHIDNAGSITANNADIQLTAANAVIVVTDPVNGLGVLMQQPIDIQNNRRFIENSGSIIANNGNIHLNTYRTADLNIAAVHNTGLINAVAIDEQNGRIFLTEQIAPPSIPPEIEDEIEEILTEIQNADTTESAVTESSAGSDLATSEGNSSTLNQIIPNCDPEFENSDCKKQNALKNFLGRMLIGGGLP